MKRILAIILACTILSGLIGCDHTKPDSQDPSYIPLDMTPGESYTSYEGVEIQIDSLIWHEGNLKSSLVVVWQTEHSLVILVVQAPRVEVALLQL